MSYIYNQEKVYPYKVLTPPCEKVLPLSLVKSHLKITASNRKNDSLLSLYIDAVALHVEKVTKRTLITTTFTTYRDNFCQNLTLRRAPFQSIDRFEYFSDSTLTTVSTSLYQIPRSDSFSEIKLKVDQQWPTPDVMCEAIEIDFKAGYGDKSENIPADLRNAMLEHVAAMYLNRGDCADCSKSAPAGSTQIYKNYRILDPCG